MSDLRPADVAAWIDQAPSAAIREFRQAVHIVLFAISESSKLPQHLYIKGGILLALAHDGKRHTRDIDFSTAETVESLPPKWLKEELAGRLIISVDTLEYDLDCRIQSSRIMPPGDDRGWQTFAMNVGYAPYSNPNRHRRLLAGQSPFTVKVECSYNETIEYVDAIELAPSGRIRSYALVDVYAEKFRAMIQQPIRNRYRRQDAYDLYSLLERYGSPCDDEPDMILQSLLAKSRSRGIEPARDSLRDPGVRRHSQAEYLQLSQEIEGELPNFDAVFDRVVRFYEALPWNTG